jgi:ABC-type multidrug transport system permease subunit
METPILIFTPMLYQIIIYFGIGLTLTAGKFFYFYLITVLLVFCASSFGYLLSSIFTNTEAAVSLSPVVMLPIILFGGVFTNVDTYYVWIRWLQYVSPIRYSLEALINNEYHDRDTSPHENPMVFLNFNLGMTKCLIILAALTIALRIIAMICLKLLVSRFQ